MRMICRCPLFALPLDDYDYSGFGGNVSRDNETRDDSLAIDSGPWVSASALDMQVTSTSSLLYLKNAKHNPLSIS